MNMHGWRLISLITAALLGGYAVASAAGIFLGSVLTEARSEAALVGHLLSLFVYVGVILWVFHKRRPLQAWLVIGIASTLLAGAGLALQ